MAVSAFLEENYSGVLDENADSDVIKFIRKVEELLEGQEVAYVLNPERVAVFAEAYKYVKDTFSGDDGCKVGYTVRDNSNGCVWDIKVSGSKVVLKMPKSFTENVLDRATCFEFVPYLDGSVEFNITFSNMAQKG